MDELNPDHSWEKDKSIPKFINGHAYTDVHWPDGTASWIEAQLPGDEGIDRDKKKMDDDGDGKITVKEGGYTGDPTDGKYRIHVYKNRAEAEAAQPGAFNGN